MNPDIAHDAANDAAQGLLVSKKSNGMDVPTEQANWFFQRTPCALAYISSDLVWQMVNAAGEALLGLVRADIIGKPLRAVYGLAAPGEFPSRVERVMNCGQAEQYESQARVAGISTRRWMRVSVDPDFGLKGEVVGVFVTAVDIDDARRAQTTVRAQQRLIDHHLDHSYIAFSQTDSQFRQVRWSGSAERIFGWTAQEAIGKSVIELGAVHPDDIAAAKRAQEEVRRLPASARIYRRYRNFTKDGREIWCDWYLTRANDEVTGEMSILAFAVDVTERVQANRLLTKSVQVDSLTQLPNRHAFYAWADEAFNASSMQGSLFFIDLDGFKEVNDRYGHETGDLLLISIAASLRHALPSATQIVRYGGDEFLVFHETTSPGHDDRSLANTITSALRSPFEVGELSIEISCSVGIAVFGEHGRHASDLVRFADLAMYQAKSNGKDQHAVFTAEMRDTHSRRQSVFAGLREALREDRIEVFYQPFVSVCSGEVTGAEALVRWRERDGTYIEPGSFIALAEETGLIHELGATVMRRACEFAVKMNANLSPGTAPFVVSVNVSGYQLRYQFFVEQTEFMLEQTQCAAQWIEFEITESRAIIEPQMLDRLQQIVMRLGIRCALDDFGTGFSNMGELSALPISTLKIDQSFVSVLTPQNTAVVAAIIALAKSLGLETVAEGVETQQQLEVLRRLGCDCFQGYLHSRPTPESEFMQRYAPFIAKV